MQPPQMQPPMMGGMMPRPQMMQQQPPMNSYQQQQPQQPTQQFQQQQQDQLQPLSMSNTSAFNPLQPPPPSNQFTPQLSQALQPPPSFPGQQQNLTPSPNFNASPYQQPNQLRPAFPPQPQSNSPAQFPPSNLTQQLSNLSLQGPPQPINQGMGQPPLGQPGFQQQPHQPRPMYPPQQQIQQSAAPPTMGYNQFGPQPMQQQRMPGPPPLMNGQQQQQPFPQPGNNQPPPPFLGASTTMPMGRTTPYGPQQPLQQPGQFNGPPQQQFMQQNSNFPPQQQPQGFPPQQQFQQQQQQPQFDQLPQQSGSQQRMDMDQMPNPIEVMQVNSTKYGDGYFETNEAGKIPPLTSTEFICKDLGNCNPRFMRSSIYSVPANPDLLKHSKLPLALCLTPFSELKPEEKEPPVSDLGELGPVRCKRCKAYMSPFMSFIDNGKRFQCPFCEDITTVPQEYFNHLDHMGKRIDMYERPELCFGSYEFVATKDYCRQQTLPTPPAFIFMIDVSVNSIRSGLLHVLCPYIKNVILPNLPRDHVAQTENNTSASPVKVGFVTYDKELHFYNLKSSLAAPQMMIVSDVEEIFVPILDGFLVNLSESKQVIDSLLDSLPTIFHENKETELILGPVVEAGIEALKSAKCAGKLFIFHTNLPSSLAPGQLKNRDDKKLLGSDKEKQVLSPQTDYYANLGKKCVENGCSVDMFLLPNQHCDIATLADLSRKVGGQIYKYDFFMADTHGKRLCEDLRYAIDATVAFDAVMKIRTSTGIKAVDYLGNFNMYGNDVELAGMQRQSSLSIELKHEDKLNENSRVYIQMALLYTSISGQRRIRLHNLSLAVCTQYSQMFTTCELDTLINYMAKLACRSILQSTPKSIKENLINQVSHILASYRKNCTNAPSKGQFILPETLKLLPVFSNSLLKSDAISGAQNVSVDERAWLMHRLMSMDIKSSYVYFYPRLLPLLEIETENTIPGPIRCLYERLKDDGLYLLENGLTMYLWLGTNLEANIVQNLFGVNSQQLNVEKCQLLELDTPISINVRSAIKLINEQRKTHLKLIVVRQRDTLEQYFKNQLVEDKGINGTTASYVEYLYHLHKEIKEILS